MLTAFAAMIVIAVVADSVLDQIGFWSQDRYSSQSVRLD